MRGLLRSEQAWTVLAGVKATPCGWPAPSLDPGCGRRRTTTGEAGREKNGQDPLNSGLYGSRGLPDRSRGAGVGDDADGVVRDRGLLAGKIPCRVGSIHRFGSAAAFAAYTGTAPIAVFSAEVVRHRLSQWGIGSSTARYTSWQPFPGAQMAGGQGLGFGLGVGGRSWPIQRRSRGRVRATYSRWTYRVCCSMSLASDVLRWGR